MNATATQPPHGLNDPQTAWDKAIVSTWNDGFNQTGVCRLNNYATTFQASVCDLEAHPLLTHLARVPTLRVGHISPHKFELDAADQLRSKSWQDSCGLGAAVSALGVLERQGYRNTHAPSSRTCEMVKALTFQCTAGNLLKKSRIIALIDSSPS